MGSGENSGVPTTEQLQASDDSTFRYSRNTIPHPGRSPSRWICPPTSSHSWSRHPRKSS